MKQFEAKTLEEAEEIITLHTSGSQPFYMCADYWLNSQFSIARFYGGMTFNDMHYQIDYDTGDLVRSDCYELYVKFYKPDRPKLKEAE